MTVQSQDDGVQIIENAEGKRTTPSFVAFTEAGESFLECHGENATLGPQGDEICIDLSCFLLLYCKILLLNVRFSSSCGPTTHRALIYRTRCRHTPRISEIMMEVDNMPP